ncbi:hypothetical protein LPJ64_001917 [Coemansia asiatica]|uniref:PhoD-like phosphatase domain-containing protein n=1 Tax=Coemansia asiatica TaxID=1052880 RepID=A0A9W7XP10_9FUNG|nr:hypothetical protein LPJ64_001917 [Coemansia asiatica]
MNQQGGGGPAQQHPAEAGPIENFSPTNPFSSNSFSAQQSPLPPPGSAVYAAESPALAPTTTAMGATAAAATTAAEDMAARLASLQLNSSSAGNQQTQQTSLHQAYAAGYGGGDGHLMGAPAMMPPHSSPAQIATTTMPRQTTAATGSFAPGYGPPPPPPQQQQQQQQQQGYVASTSPPPPQLIPQQQQQQIQQQQVQTQQLVMPAMIGPMLQFVDVELETAQWRGSVLVLTNEAYLPHPVQPPASGAAGSSMHAGPSSAQAPNLHVPIIEMWDDGVHGPGTGKPKTFTTRAIYTEPTFKYTFWRADIALSLPQEAEVDVVYQVHWGADEHAIQSYSARPTYGFRLPAQASQWRMCVTSNLQFTRRVPEPARAALRGSGPVLRDLLAKHRANPFHVWMGTGGQFLGEGVWDDCEHALRPFLLHGIDHTRRTHVPWTAEMSAAVERWYFLEYLRQWFGVGAVHPSEAEGQACIKQAVETIPYTFTPDCDILPEMGSYVPALHFSQVFGGVKHIGSKYFALFQAHTTPTLAHNEHEFLAEGFHSIKKLGPYTAILTIDTRSERQPAGIVDRHSYDMLFSELEARVPLTTTNLIVVSANPVIFPRTRSFEPILRGAATSGLAQIISYAVGGSSSGSGGNGGKQTRNDWVAKDRFGEVVAVTKLNDFWTANNHKSERLFVVRSLQEFARRRSVRVTFASGHVNCLSAGHFRTYTDSKFDPRKYPEQRGFLSDFRSMIQLTVSGAVQEPADSLTLRAYHFAGKSSSFDMYTEEKLYHTFNVDVNHLPPPNNNQKLLARRSYGILIEHDFDNDRQHPGLLSFFYVENESCSGTATPYIINIPPLRYPQIPFSAGTTFAQGVRPTLRPSVSYRSYTGGAGAAAAAGAIGGGAAAAAALGAGQYGNEQDKAEDVFEGGDPYAFDVPGYEGGGVTSPSPPPYSSVPIDMAQQQNLPPRTDGTYSSSYEHTAAWVQQSSPAHTATNGSETGGPGRPPSSQPVMSQGMMSQGMVSQGMVSQGMVPHGMVTQPTIAQTMVSSQALPVSQQMSPILQPQQQLQQQSQQQQQQMYGQHPHYQ